MGAKRQGQMTAQAVGAYGEKSVEAELLRRGWLPANVNASIKNAADFDIFAVKSDRAVYLRVKTCGPSLTEFQFGVSASEKIATDGLSGADFTVLVQMGASRAEDNFYILPTGEVRKVINARRRSWLSKTRRDGAPRKDIGMWALRLQDRRDGVEESGYGLARIWSGYLNNWELLEKG
jgi:hypothetical protein